MSKLDNLIGNIYGRLTVISRASNNNHNTQWNCVCECGSKTVVRGSNLRKGASTSCGCFFSENLRRLNTTHGMSKTLIYHLWWKMIERCRNNKLVEYKNYGGRGIQVCERWMIFENFFADMGIPAKGMTLDRIDNNGHYEPKNCRWATRVQQNRNKRSNVLCEVDAERIRDLYRNNIKQIDIARYFGLNKSTVRNVASEKTWATK